MGVSESLSGAGSSGVRERSEVSGVRKPKGSQPVAMASKERGWAVRGKRGRSIRTIARVLAVAVIAGGPGPSLGQSPQLGDSENPLRRHREALSRGRTERPIVQGAVTGVQDGEIETTVSWRELEAHGVRDFDRVDLVIGELNLPARLVTADGYRRLRSNREAVTQIDVDVVGVPGPDEAIVLLGLSGDLASFLGAYPGMPVMLRLR